MACGVNEKCSLLILHDCEEKETIEKKVSELRYQVSGESESLVNGSAYGTARQNGIFVWLESET